MSTLLDVLPFINEKKMEEIIYDGKRLKFHDMVLTSFNTEEEEDSENSEDSSSDSETDVATEEKHRTITVPLEVGNRRKYLKEEKTLALAYLKEEIKKKILTCVLMKEDDKTIRKVLTDIPITDDLLFRSTTNGNRITLCGDLDENLNFASGLSMRMSVQVVKYISFKDDEMYESKLYWIELRKNSFYRKRNKHKIRALQEVFLKEFLEYQPTDKEKVASHKVHALLTGFITKEPSHIIMLYMYSVILSFE